MRNILRSSLSSIAYLRYLFPEESFTDSQLAGLKIKSLVPKDNPEIQALTDWLEKGVFDALEKHYLRALVFSIFKEYNNPNSLLESYTFKFSYPSDGEISLNVITSAKGHESTEMNYMNREQIQQAWCTMIRTLITLSHTLPPLPSQRHMAMRLYYYEEITPPDYEPPGFSRATDAPNFEFIADPECIEIGGNVNTKFHTVSLRLDTAMPNYTSNVEDVVDEKLDLAIMAIYEADFVTKKYIAAKTGLNLTSDAGRIQAIFDELTRLGYISDKNSGSKGRKVLKSSALTAQYDEIASKYNELNEKDESPILEENDSSF